MSRLSLGQVRVRRFVEPLKYVEYRDAEYMSAEHVDVEVEQGEDEIKRRYVVKDFDSEI